MVGIEGVRRDREGREVVVKTGCFCFLGSEEQGEKERMKTIALVCETSLGLAARLVLLHRCAGRPGQKVGCGGHSVGTEEKTRAR